MLNANEVLTKLKEQNDLEGTHYIKQADDNDVYFLIVSATDSSQMFWMKQTTFANRAGDDIEVFEDGSMTCEKWTKEFNPLAE